MVSLGGFIGPCGKFFLVPLSNFFLTKGGGALAGPATGPRINVRAMGRRNVTRNYSGTKTSVRLRCI